MSELRWNPLLGEWVGTATERQDRTFLPPKDFCPLCPTKPGGFPTEVPEPTYDIVVFENRFPSLRSDPPKPAVENPAHWKSVGIEEEVRLAKGVCEVVLYSPDHNSTLATQSVEQIHKLIKVWRDRFFELGLLDFVDYVFIFENKGEEIGVTLTHPHGQIYAYPFIPPKIQTELDRSQAHYAEHNACLICGLMQSEIEDKKRIVAENEDFICYIPFFARWPYEVHVVSKRHLQALTDFTDREEWSLAEIMKTLLCAYDRVFDKSMPYMMVMHQRPTDGGSYDHYHFHIEFYPPLRTATKLKYLAGSETGAGFFINDTLADDKAAELRQFVSQVARIVGDLP